MVILRAHSVITALASGSQRTFSHLHRLIMASKPALTTSAGRIRQLHRPTPQLC